MIKWDSQNTLPSCLGYFEQPIGQNDCSACKLIVICKKFFPRKKVEKIKQHIGKIEILLQDAMKQLTIGGSFH